MIPTDLYTMDTVREVKLEDLKNMARVLAEIEIKARGEYRCVIGGEKVVVYRSDKLGAVTIPED